MNSSDLTPQNLAPPVREPALQIPKLPKNTKGALFSAPSQSISFFFTLYIQNSMPQRVKETRFAYLFLPRNQSLAAKTTFYPP